MARRCDWSQLGHGAWVDLCPGPRASHADRVFALVFGMMVCLALALAVVGLVAVPARRDGRELLTHRGEELVHAVKERSRRS